jgi:hypothetical protein
VEISVDVLVNGLRSLQTEPPKGSVGFGEILIVKRGRYSSMYCFDIGKVSRFLANEGGTTGLPSFLDGGPCLFLSK